MKPLRFLIHPLRIRRVVPRWLRGGLLAGLAFGASSFALAAAPPPSPAAPAYGEEAEALRLARSYLEGGPDAQAALLEALKRMGWGVRNTTGQVVHAAPAGADTGLAMRDYELDELLWEPSRQPQIRLISMAQALAIPFENADPEEVAQLIVGTVRRSVGSEQPQQRFWGLFVAALGRVNADGFDFAAPGSAGVIPPDYRRLERLQREALQNPMALIDAMQPKHLWPADDPVLAASPRPDGAASDGDGETTSERDARRMEEIPEESMALIALLSSADETVRAAAEAKMDKLNREMAAVSHRVQAANLYETAQSYASAPAAQDDDEDANDDDSDYEDSWDDDDDWSDDDEEESGARFLAEWREQPLSLLQVALITRVLAADVRQAATRGPVTVEVSPLRRLVRRLTPPVAWIGLAQIAAPDLGQQFAGAAGDIWATGWGTYTGDLLQQHLPDSKFTKGVGIANLMIAWFKTIMTVARQNITIEVENAPLVRTKTRAAGQQRTARARVVVDFPKSDALKALRAAANLSSLDLQLPDGGPISGARVVWRLPEGSYNGKYQTAAGGSTYRPDLAVVQFARAGGKEAYVSTTNDAGEATITLEGTPQRRNLPNTVRPYPRRAAVGVEVTMKVGNLTQDLNDAIATALGGPISGGLGFIADMVLRTSFFFHKTQPFEVTDWKEPAWQGEFEIEVKAAGSKTKKPEKGGPPITYTWRVDRLMEGRLHTPEWAEEIEQDSDYAHEGRHRLEIDGDSRYFRLDDASSAQSPKIDNRYEAHGPLRLPPPRPDGLRAYSRSEPSGSAELLITGGIMQLDLRPFFGAECLVARSERNEGHSSQRSGPEFLSLLGDIYPESFTVTEPIAENQDHVEGIKTFSYKGGLPYVPDFDVEVTLRYKLWKNGPPPRNQPR